MPNKCCVPRCRGNYKNGSKVRIFRFPKDEELRQKWIRAIPRENFLPTENTRVSSSSVFFFLHIPFNERCASVIREALPIFEYLFARHKLSSTAND